ncbi:response regulator [Sphingobium chlorophenolicum]|uniref:Chemotaxis protein CheY n=1 Tax=Sphingobium chlorophenolicum TaxID=46429 RepID=A0A081RE29_SPHCR|nr:response regulator [Sphingobium chlorophenolicum]KEQ53452.1 Chemotaxis protein CheY [Sphingobium chlorophenolicum]
MANRATSGTCSVLVVEDEYFLASDLSALLAEEGFTVIGPHGSLFGALKAIGGKAPDIALLDVNLHGEMCYPLMDELIARSVPIVIATGYDGQALPDRFDACVRVAKPYRRDEMLGAIDTALAGASCRP